MEKISAYSNRVAINISSFDVMINFMKVTPDVDGNGKIIGELNDDHVQIIMSLQHAKALSDILNQQLSKYEKDFGPINTSKKAATKQDSKE